MSTILYYNNFVLCSFIIVLQETFEGETFADFTVLCLSAKVFSANI